MFPTTQFKSLMSANLKINITIEIDMPYATHTNKQHIFEWGDSSGKEINHSNKKQYKVDN